MRTTTFAQSREVIELVDTHQNGVSLKRFSELVTERFGYCARFQDGSLIGIDLIDLLVLLEGRDELRVVSGVVYPSGRQSYFKTVETRTSAEPFVTGEAV